MIHAQISAIQQDLEENRRYKTKLLKRLEPLQEELKAYTVESQEDSQSVVSTSQHSLREDRPAHRQAGEARKAPSSKAGKPQRLSEEMQVKHDLNAYLAELNVIYQAKLEILKNPFYDKDNLENSLQRFILSDCIEYREYGIEAYEILSMHEKLLEVTLEEKKTRQEIELKDNLRVLPVYHEEAQKKKLELQELQRIFERQQSVAARDADHPQELRSRPRLPRETQAVAGRREPPAGQADHAEAGCREGSVEETACSDRI